jgi:hypothetical protein
MFGVNYRERFMHKETQIEMVERKENEEEEDSESEAKR